MNEERTRVIIGVDAHKRTHTLVAVDEAGRKLGEWTVAATPRGPLASSRVGQGAGSIEPSLWRTAGMSRDGLRPTCSGQTKLSCESPRGCLHENPRLGRSRDPLSCHQLDDLAVVAEGDRPVARLAVPVRGSLPMAP